MNNNLLMHKPYCKDINHKNLIIKNIASDIMQKILEYIKDIYICERKTRWRRKYAKPRWSSLLFFDVLTIKTYKRLTSCVCRSINILDKISELLHIPRRRRLPWPPSCCLDEPIPFLAKNDPLVTLIQMSKSLSLLYSNFDDQFVRQNLYEPPFMVSSDFTLFRYSSSSSSLRTLIKNLDRLLGPCFKINRLKPFFQYPKHSQQVVYEKIYAEDLNLSDYRGIGLYKLSPKRKPPSKYHLTTKEIDIDFRKLIKSIQPKIKSFVIDFRKSNTGVKRFSFNNFHLFSSLPHSTCSLSISCQYLALDEIYHPFWTCITELERIAKHGILTFYDVPFQGTLTTPLNRKHTFKLQFIRVEP
ncbi:hypothetical protein H8356DRAFT_1388725 [Neocallimastix lanati (nom. inval.)]|nr:hypothetical protein H8356DRAFT_1388725 [Neocallimastix sp. JGI-2020a]